MTKQNIDESLEQLIEKARSPKFSPLFVRGVMDVGTELAQIKSALESIARISHSNDHLRVADYRAEFLKQLRVLLVASIDTAFADHDKELQLLLEQERGK